MTEGATPSVILEQSVRESLAGVTDKAAADLALTYARDIDGGGDLAKLGPALLSVLSSLLLTPAARAAAMKGVRSASDKPATRRGDELRERRARKGRAADLDSATS
jgi:hypothetical protein